MNVTWGPPALRGVITHTAPSFVVVTRATSWGLMALPATVRDPVCPRRMIHVVDIQHCIVSKLGLARVVFSTLNDGQ